MSRTRNRDPQTDSAPSAPAESHEIIATPVAINNPLVPSPDTPLSSCPTNINVSDNAGKIALFNALSAPLPELGANAYIDLHVTRWLVSWRESPDAETGEVRQYPTLTLIEPNGRAVAFTSAVLLDRWSRLIPLFSADDGALDVYIRITATTSRRQRRTFHDLTLLLPPEVEG